MAYTVHTCILGMQIRYVKGIVNVIPRDIKDKRDIFIFLAENLIFSIEIFLLQSE